MPKPTSSTDETVSAGSSLQEANIPGMQNFCYDVLMYFLVVVFFCFFFVFCFFKPTNNGK